MSALWLNLCILGQFWDSLSRLTEPFHVLIKHTRYLDNGLEFWACITNENPTLLLNAISQSWRNLSQRELQIQLNMLNIMFIFGMLHVLYCQTMTFELISFIWLSCIIFILQMQSRVTKITILTNDINCNLVKIALHLKRKEKIIHFISGMISFCILKKEKQQKRRWWHLRSVPSPFNINIFGFCIS